MKYYYKKKHEKKQEWLASYWVKLTMFIIDKILKQGKGTFNVIHYFGDFPMTVNYGFDTNSFSLGFQAQVEGCDRTYRLNPLYILSYLFECDDKCNLDDYYESDEIKEHEPRIIRFIRKYNPSIKEVSKFSFAKQLHTEYSNNKDVYCKETGSFINTPENRNILPRVVYLKFMANLEHQLYDLMSWDAVYKYALEFLRGDVETGLIPVEFELNGEYKYGHRKATIDFNNLCPILTESGEYLIEEYMCSIKPNDFILDMVSEKYPSVLKNHRITFEEFRKKVIVYNREQGNKQFQDWWKVFRGEGYPIPVGLGGIPHQVICYPLFPHIDCYLDYCAKLNIPFIDSEEKERGNSR